MRLSQEDIQAIGEQIANRLAESNEFQDKLIDRLVERLYLQTGKSVIRKMWSAMLVGMAVVVVLFSGFEIKIPEWMKHIAR